MPYVDRDELTGKVRGLFARKQPHMLIPEVLPEDDPEVVEFKETQESARDEIDPGFSPALRAFIKANNLRLPTKEEIQVERQKAKLRAQADADAEALLETQREAVRIERKDTWMRNEAGATVEDWQAAKDANMSYEEWFKEQERLRAEAEEAKAALEEVPLKESVVE